MKERPIIFSAPMVRALLDGRKTQTRRIVKSQYDDPAWSVRPCEITRFKGHTHDWWLPGATVPAVPIIKCPYGRPGDRLWVKETFAHHVQAVGAKRDEDGPFVYAADGEFAKQYRLGDKWKSPIFMRRAASRILLEIVAIRVERLQDISEEDAKAEGADPAECCLAYYHGYRKLWEAINGAGSWDVNPYVWVIEFKPHC